MPITELPNNSLSQATMSTILKYSRVARVPISRHARALAIPAASGSPAPKKSSFTETLADGPSLDDFVSENVPERIVLGNKNTHAETFFLTGHSLTVRTTYTLDPVLACLPS